MASSSTVPPAFVTPFTCIIAGATGSGKTNFLTQALLWQSETFSCRHIDRLVYCYGTYLEETFATLRQYFPTIELINGLPTDDTDFDSSENNVLIIDDLMTDAVKSSTVSNYFTRGSHHKNLSVILLTQNYFHQGSVARTINLNAHYTVLFKNPRNVQQVSFIGRQMFSTDRELKEAYKDATSRPYGYLFIDFKQSTPDQMRMRTNVLPTDPEPRNIVYVPKMAN